MAGDITRVSLLLYLEPVVSVLGAAVFLGERVTPVMIGGGLVIMAGVVIAGTGRSRRLPESGSVPAGSPAQSGDAID